MRYFQSSVMASGFLFFYFSFQKFYGNDNMRGYGLWNVVPLLL